MLKKTICVVILICFITIPIPRALATELGIHAGALFPAAKFDHVADIGVGLGSDITLTVYEDLHYGLSVNYASSQGSHGVNFWEMNIYPFIDWVCFRTNQTDVFLRGGIGLSHWEADGIWWLGSEGNGITATFGAGCKLSRNIEIIASFTKLYADFDVDYFLLRLGYDFYLGD